MIILIIFYNDDYLKWLHDVNKMWTALATLTLCSAQSCLTLLQPHGREPTKAPRSMEFPGKK